MFRILHAQLRTSSPLFTRMREGAGFAIRSDCQSRTWWTGAHQAFGSVIAYVTTVMRMRAELLVASARLIRAIPTIRVSIAQKTNVDTASLIIAKSRRMEAGWRLKFSNKSRLVVIIRSKVQLPWKRIPFRPSRQRSPHFHHIAIWKADNGNYRHRQILLDDKSRYRNHVHLIRRGSHVAGYTPRRKVYKYHLHNRIRWIRIHAWRQ